MTTLPSIFISYSRVDSAFVDQLEAELSKHGFATWVDRQHLEAGKDWAAVIEAQIKRHDLVMVVLSPDSVASEWVSREIAFAEQFGKEIIPILFKTTQVPIRLVTLQFVDMTRDFTSGLVQLRTALSKQRTNSSPQQNQPSTYTPPSSIQQNVLVNIPVPPPAPPPDLEVLYMQARSAFARADWDTAEALLQQVVARDPNYDRGAARSDAAIARKNLLPVQIKRLQTKADAAHRAGQWGEEIACWKAAIGLDSYYQEARQRLPIAEQNQQSERIYKRAVAFAKAKDLIAARSEIERLKKEAPYYGDPEQLGPQIGTAISPNYIGHQQQSQQQRQMELQQQKLQEQTRLEREQSQKRQLQPIDQEINEIRRKISEIERKEFRLRATFFGGIQGPSTFLVYFLFWLPLITGILMFTAAIFIHASQANTLIGAGTGELGIALFGFFLSFINVKLYFSSFNFNKQKLENYLRKKRNRHTRRLHARLEALSQSAMRLQAQRYKTKNGTRQNRVP